MGGVIDSPESHVVVCNNVVLSSSHQLIVCAYAIVHINIAVNVNIIFFIFIPLSTKIKPPKEIGGRVVSNQTMKIPRFRVNPFV